MAPVVGFDLPAVLAHELRIVLARQRGPAWECGGRDFEARFTKETQAWLQSMLATPPADPQAQPLDAAGEEAAFSKRLDHSISQLLALCAYCGFAKRQDQTVNAEKQPTL
jgi:hypothetical protein